jgi:hypothetical protein
MPNGNGILRSGAELCQGVIGLERSQVGNTCGEDLDTFWCADVVREGREFVGRAEDCPRVCACCPARSLAFGLASFPLLRPAPHTCPRCISNPTAAGRRTVTVAVAVVVALWPSLIVYLKVSALLT